MNFVKIVVNILMSKKLNTENKKNLLHFIDEKEKQIQNIKLIEKIKAV